MFFVLEDAFKASIKFPLMVKKKQKKQKKTMFYNMRVYG